MQQHRTTAYQRRNRLTLQLSIVAVAMFGFGYALVPIYDLLCDAIGINGKVETTQSLYDPSTQEVDTSREVQMRFISVQNEQTLVDIVATTPTLRANPGQVYQVDYRITNPTDDPIIIQAVPSVAPSHAADNVKKVQCFCFDNLKLAARETLEASVVFYLENTLEQDVSSVILSYTIFDITNMVQN